MAMQLEGLTFACASPIEMRAAQKLGKTALVGMNCRLGIPEGRTISYGFAGALRHDLGVAEIVDATRVIDIEGNVLWEGEPLGIKGAKTGTILGSDKMMHDPKDHLRLHEKFGADVIDMESHLYAKAGRLAGCIRIVSDTPAQPLGLLAKAMRPEGPVLYGKAVYAFIAAPVASARTVRGIRKAMRAMHELSFE
jgi:hypothetical protein